MGVCGSCQQGCSAVAPEVNLKSSSGRRRALLVGINYNGTSDQLHGCVNDIHNQKAALISQYGFSESDFLMLSDGSGYPESDRPTKARILEGFEWLFDGAASGDLLYFAYSGHGTHVGAHEAICPLDGNFRSPGNFILDTEIHATFYEGLPTGVNCVCMFDACHSGRIADLSVVRSRNAVRCAGSRYLQPPADFERLESRWLATLPEPVGIFPREGTDDLLWVYSGCQDEQTSSDAYLEGMHQGAFTWAALKVLAENQWSVTYLELLNNVKPVLQQEGFKQIPALGTTGGDLLDYAFLRTARFPQDSVPCANMRTSSGRRRALLVGINYVGTSSRLRGCVNDVENQKRALIAQYGFSESDFLVLSDGAGYPEADRPTKARIQEAFKWLFDGATAGDFLFFAYSGHGTHVGSHEAICPLDGNFRSPENFILDTEIHATFYEGLPTGVNCVCMFDACHSGRIADLSVVRAKGAARPSGSRYLQPPADFERRYSTWLASLPEPVGIFPRNGADDLLWVFSGCQDEQTSSDAPIGGVYQGAFTWAALQVLSENDWNLTYLELLDNVKDALKQKSFEQIPALGTTSDALLDYTYLVAARDIKKRIPCTSFGSPAV